MATSITALSLCTSQTFSDIVVGDPDDHLPGMPDAPAAAAATYYGLAAFQVVCAAPHLIAPEAVSRKSPIEPSRCNLHAISARCDSFSIMMPLKDAYILGQKDAWAQIAMCTLYIVLRGL